ncbi:hypothetical protein [Acidovorax sp. A1169]|uniref:hypothetical protein n=1 Tax=Acidovorax sp. A1169 TaxID=3059524 RepID=UPI0027379166|nr:hypothetical protein [Acidovorax sp. A1169]MDP4077228.1 hypothetical protein [Acidovorax sp. A1169]
MQAAPEPIPHRAPALPLVWRVLAWVVAIGACLAVFAMYTAPEFMVMLADQVWSCF